jgi:hypothetical protein
MLKKNLWEDYVNKSEINEQEMCVCECVALRFSWNGRVSRIAKKEMLTKFWLKTWLK